MCDVKDRRRTVSAQKAARTALCSVVVPLGPPLADVPNDVTGRQVSLTLPTHADAVLGGAAPCRHSQEDRFTGALVNHASPPLTDPFAHPSLTVCFPTGRKRLSRVTRCHWVSWDARTRGATRATRTEGELDRDGGEVPCRWLQSCDSSLSHSHGISVLL